jgi:NAD(P)-dependent dehydrogenase (short-subunit alcohol dehydrogenase family)
MGFLWYDAESDMPDMFGKVAIVTGGNSGIGFEVCKQLCKRQCTVFMAVRDMDKGQGWVVGLPAGG